MNGMLLGYVMLLGGFCVEGSVDPWWKRDTLEELWRQRLFAVRRTRVGPFGSGAGGGLGWDDGYEYELSLNCVNNIIEIDSRPLYNWLSHSVILYFKPPFSNNIHIKSWFLPRSHNSILQFNKLGTLFPPFFFPFSFSSFFLRVFIVLYHPSATIVTKKIYSIK